MITSLLELILEMVFKLSS